MKIALTADIHLTSKKDHPERFNAFNDILSQMKAGGIEHLIVAGDLFDQSFKNYGEFDNLCKLKKYQGIQIHIIPGNHDPNLDVSQFVSENIHIYSESSQIFPDPSGLPFLMLPYQPGRTMGEALEEVASELKPREWILIGHGDFSGGLRAYNPMEPGFYMPLTTRDIERYLPREVFLGHIHDSPDYPRVHYCGSPCGLDINETGRRHYLIYDTEDHSIERVSVQVDRIFCNETLVVLPIEDEEEYVCTSCEAMIKAWGFSDEELAKVILRLRVSGFCSDKASIDKTIQKVMAPFPTYKEEGIDTSGLSVADDVDRQNISVKVHERIQDLEWVDCDDEPAKEQILTEALQLIYGG